MDIYSRSIREISEKVIILTAYGTIETAVEAMKLEAFDYILKPVDVEELKIVVKRALRIAEITQENIMLKSSLSSLYQSFHFIAESKSMHMQNLFPIINKASEVDSPLLIRGETGVGKSYWQR